MQGLLVCAAMIGALLSATPTFAFEADCLADIGGVRVVDGPCSFTILEQGRKSFTMRPLSHGALGANYTIRLIARPNQKTGDLYFSDDQRHIQDKLPELRQNRACWQNDFVNICAWKIGQRRGPEAFTSTQDFQNNPAVAAALRPQVTTPNKPEERSSSEAASGISANNPCHLITEPQRRLSCYDSFAPPPASAGREVASERVQSNPLTQPTAPSALTSTPQTVSTSPPSTIAPAQELQASDPPKQEAKRENSAGNEIAFVDAITRGKKAYLDAQNDLQKGAARAARKNAICDIGDLFSVVNWKGKVATLSSNGDGKGVLSIAISDTISVSTTNNALSDALEHTLVDPNSDVYKQMLTLKVGDQVSFSGFLRPSNTDCVEERSLTMDGSMNRPEFVMHFTSVEKAN